MVSFSERSVFVIALDGLKVCNKVDKYVWCLVGLFFITISRTLAIVAAIGFKGFAIGYAGVANGFAGIANGFEGVANGFAGIANGFEGVANGFEGVTNGFEGVANGFEGIANGFEGVVIGNVYCTFSNLCSVIGKVRIANAPIR